MADEDKPKLVTTPWNRKLFPATNQAHYCWQRYNEYVLCLKKTEGDEEAKAAACKIKYSFAKSICPVAWVTQWDEQRVAGNFLGVQENDPAPDTH